jgi:hypothetical protein
MPNFLTPIASQVLTTTAASVTFSAIPGTFTDLMLKMSARESINGLDISVEVNADSATNYSRMVLGTTNNTPYSQRFANQAYAYIIGQVNSSVATANTFSNSELYIANYSATGAKQLSSFGVTESNVASGDYTTTQTVVANLYRGTAAITIVKISASANFVAGSRFDLYGILKA